MTEIMQLNKAIATIWNKWHSNFRPSRIKLDTFKYACIFQTIILILGSVHKTFVKWDTKMVYSLVISTDIAGRVEGHCLSLDFEIK